MVCLLAVPQASQPLQAALGNKENHITDDDYSDQIIDKKKIIIKERRS